MSPECLSWEPSGCACAPNCASSGGPWLALAVLLGADRRHRADRRRQCAAHRHRLPSLPAPEPCRGPAGDPGAVGVPRLLPRRCPPPGGGVGGSGGVPADVPAGPGASPFSGMVAEASPFGGDGVSIDRVKVLAGRIFDPADPRAVMINQQLADQAHLRPGGTLHLIGYPQRDGSPDIAHAVRLAFRVSAIVVFADQIVSASGNPGTAAAAEPGVRPHPAGAVVQSGWRRRLRGAPARRRRRRVHPPGRRPGRALPGGERPGRPPGHRRMRRASGRSGRKRPRWRSSPRSVGLIALAIIGQLLSRQLVLDSAEFPILRALGMSQVRPCRAVAGQGGDRDHRRGRRRRGGCDRGVPADAHRARPVRRAQPRVEVNLAILGAGFALIAVAPLLVVAPAARAGRGPGPGRARAGRARRARAPLPAGPGARAGGLGAGQPGGADGVRARSRAHRGSGAQRARRDDGGGGGGRGGHGLRRQLPRAGRHAAPVRAELGPAAGPAGRLRAAHPRAAESWRGSEA